MPCGFYCSSCFSTSVSPWNHSKIPRGPMCNWPVPFLSAQLLFLPLFPGFLLPPKPVKSPLSQAGTALAWLGRLRLPWILDTQSLSHETFYPLLRFYLSPSLYQNLRACGSCPLLPHQNVSPKGLFLCCCVPRDLTSVCTQRALSTRANWLSLL